MEKILKNYEEIIEQLERRIEMLVQMSKDSRLTPAEHNDVTARIELLRSEKYDLMHTAAQIRRHLAPKPLSPSQLAAERRNAS